MELDVIQKSNWMECGILQMSDTALYSHNSETIRLANEINKYLHGYQKVSMLLLPNICSLRTDYLQRPNSNLLVEDKGGGKSTLFNMIYHSNPKNITKLPSKMYASDMVKWDKTCWQNKLLMHDDLIPAFSGLSIKSKEQLMGFFTELLSAGEYKQLGNEIKDAVCNAMFGMARDYYYQEQIKPGIMSKDESDGESKSKSFKEKLFTSTFTDRVVIVTPPEKTDEQKLDVMEFMRNRQSKIPIIKLPINKFKKISIDYDKIDLIALDSMCIDFDKSRVISAQRAQNYCINFMKGNAMLNNRSCVTNYDLELLRELFPLHIANLTNYELVYKGMHDFPDLDDSEIIKRIKVARATFYRYKKIIGNKNRFLPVTTD
jgi:hypothetical protein